MFLDSHEQRNQLHVVPQGEKKIKNLCSYISVVTYNGATSLFSTNSSVVGTQTWLFIPSCPSQKVHMEPSVSPSFWDSPLSFQSFLPYFPGWFCFFFLLVTPASNFFSALDQVHPFYTPSPQEGHSLSLYFFLANNLSKVCLGVDKPKSMNSALHLYCHSMPNNCTVVNLLKWC